MQGPRKIKVFENLFKLLRCFSPSSSSEFGYAVWSEAGGQVVVFLHLVVSIPAVPVCRCRAAVALFSRVLLLPGVDLLLCRMAGQVHGHLCRAEPVQDVWVELVGEFAPHFHDLTGAAVVSQSSCHLLIGHGLAVALALAPALGQLLFVLGDEVEGAAATVCPLDWVAHVGVIQRLVEVFIKSELLTTWGGSNWF